MIAVGSSASLRSSKQVYARQTGRLAIASALSITVDPVKPMHAAKDAVFGDKQVAMFVQVNPVRRNDHSGLPLLRFDVVAAHSWPGVFAELGYDFAFFVENRDAAFEFADDGVVHIDCYRCGQAQVLSDHTHEFAIERHVHHAIVAAIAADDPRRLEAGVDRN